MHFEASDSNSFLFILLLIGLFASFLFGLSFEHQPSSFSDLYSDWSLSSNIPEPAAGNSSEITYVRSPAKEGTSTLLKMALLQTSLIWVVYAVVVAILLAVASVFIYVYQTPRDRSPSVTLTCIIAITSLLATVLLLPVDVALVSSTTSSKLGRRKEWATQDLVDKITYSLTIVYYFLYSLDALLCLLVIPFTYFWYEEYDEVATDEGEQTFGRRLWGAIKYTLSFVAIVVILFLVGFFVPISKNKSGMDLDYFKRLLTENRECL